jgi:hypothetical protein
MKKTCEHIEAKAPFCPSKSLPDANVSAGQQKAFACFAAFGNL